MNFKTKIKALLAGLIFFVGHAQERQFKIHTLAFYNLENLFDTINDPLTFDEFTPIMELKTGRGGAYRSKIKNMAHVIANIGKDVTKNTPAIIGVCEIENRKVLEDLVNDSLLLKKDYGIVHYDSPDRRGIDVALLYQKRIFSPISSTPYELRIYDSGTNKRIYTRDQLLVSGKLDNDLIHIIINHWPSRRGGEVQSNSKRISAAKLNKYIIDSLQSKDPYAKIVIMGDLNDNPTNKSIKNVLKAKKDRKKVGFKAVYNPFEKMFVEKGLGTTAYRDAWSLFDQIMLTKPLLDDDYSTYRFWKAGIYNKVFLTTKKGRYKGYPLRSFDDSGFTNGFSDHFPVYIYLIKEKR